MQSPFMSSDLMTAGEIKLFFAEQNTVDTCIRSHKLIPPFISYLLKSGQDFVL